MKYLLRQGPVQRRKGQALTEYERANLIYGFGLGLNDEQLVERLGYDIRTIVKYRNKFQQTGNNSIFYFIFS